jgi:hypothetical protein
MPHQVGTKASSARLLSLEKTSQKFGAVDIRSGNVDREHFGLAIITVERAAICQ